MTLHSTMSAGPAVGPRTQKSGPAARIRQDTGIPEPCETGASVAPLDRPHRARRSPRDHGLLTSLVAADCLAATTALAVVHPGAALIELLPTLALLVALHQQGGLYRCGPFHTLFSEIPGLLWRVALAWSATTAAVAAVQPELPVGWNQLLYVITAHLALALLLRGGAYGWRRRRQRRRPRPALVIGHPRVAGKVAAVLHDHPEYGMRAVGLVALHQAHAETDVHLAAPESPMPVLTGTEDVTRAVVQNSVCDAVLTRSAYASDETAALVQQFSALDCTLWVVDAESAPGSITWRTEDVGHVWGFPCARLDAPRRHSGARAAKRATDLVAATLGLLAAAPILALCALAVRLLDGPGVLFRQKRVGAHGRPFVMLKFRTLRPASAHESATRWNASGDHRMSAVGRLLRRTSLDELPQLWNVLRGDMSLVGPRPERPYFVQKFSEMYPGYAARSRMPVGITGLAQVNGLRGDTSIEDRARFDNHYIDTWSLWQDVQILLHTAKSVFRLAGN